MIRVLIADDQLLFRSMLEEMLKNDDEIEMVASAANGDEAVSLCLNLKPDVALLDVQMPGKSGVEVLREIKAVLPDVKAVMLTTFENSEHIATALELGADGYLVKDIKPGVLIMAIKCVSHDIVMFHKGIYQAKALQSELSQQAFSGKVQFGEVSFDGVDIAILKLIVEGKTNKDIAAAIRYSEGTIKNRISRILSATGLSDRTELSVFAIRNQIV